MLKLHTGEKPYGTKCKSRFFSVLQFHIFKTLWTNENMSTLYDYFIPFFATVKTISHPRCAVDDLMHCCPRPKAEGNSASGHSQHRGGDTFDCCTERYEIVVLLPNSEDTCYLKYFLKFE